MAGGKLKPARIVAVRVLNQFDRQSKGYVRPILDKLLTETSEKQRATDLVFGTIRNRSVIDMLIVKLANCQIQRIPGKIINIIRIGVYELVYCPSTQNYAIVNEAVNNTKKIGNTKGAGFVNAVLRQIGRHIKLRKAQLLEAKIDSTIPQTSLTGCEFDCNILPEPDDFPADYLSISFSLPKWLVTNWIDEFGFEKAKDICFASNRRGGIYIRVNTLKTTTERLSQDFELAGIDYRKIAGESTIGIKSSRTVAELPGFKEGMFSVQDLASQQVVKAINPKPDWKILDMCAAPGTKTTQLAELTADKAKIIATDIDGHRLEKVQENVDRLNINSVKIVSYEKLEDFVAQSGPFNCVLLDVPCSNTAVLSKRPEVRYRIKPEAIIELAKIQNRLLTKATALIKQHGVIIYSTCSTEKSENTELVGKFLKKSNYELEYEKLVLPSTQGLGCDGSYAAVIRAK